MLFMSVSVKLWFCFPAIELSVFKSGHRLPVEKIEPPHTNSKYLYQI